MQPIQTLYRIKGGWTWNFGPNSLGFPTITSSPQKKFKIEDGEDRWSSNELTYAILEDFYEPEEVLEGWETVSSAGWSHQAGCQCHFSLDHSRISRSTAPAGSIKMIPQPSPAEVPAVSCNGGPRQSHGDRMRFQLPGHWGVAMCCCFGMLYCWFYLVLRGRWGRVSWANWNILNPFKSNIIGWTTKKRISGLNITSVDLRGLFTVIGILPWLKKC